MKLGGTLCLRRGVQRSPVLKNAPAELSVQSFGRKLRKAFAEMLKRIGDVAKRFTRDNPDDALHRPGRETLASQGAIQKSGLKLRRLLVVANTNVGNSDDLIEKPRCERNGGGHPLHGDLFDESSEFFLTPNVADSALEGQRTRDEQFEKRVQIRLSERPLEPLVDEQRQRFTLFELGRKGGFRRLFPQRREEIHPQGRVQKDLSTVRIKGQSREDEHSSWCTFGFCAAHDLKTGHCTRAKRLALSEATQKHVVALFDGVVALGQTLTAKVAHACHVACRAARGYGVAAFFHPRLPPSLPMITKERRPTTTME